ncbi:MAG: alanine aminotransferase [Methanobacteriota archaeon]|nr:MAG: alanine aminotransferase [Euryarchaeota archaeon]|tara:strand:- start:11777 stop:13015 length:1239 start_codon:yes stop_codon:yes gene_type:complete
MSSNHIKVTDRATKIEYAIRDVVVPATKLEEEGHEIIKLNIGDPLAYPGLPTPEHMVQAFQEALSKQENGYSHSYGMMDLRIAISKNEKSKNNGGWNCNPDDVYVCHGVTEALQIIFAAFLEEGDLLLSPGPHYPPYLTYPQLYGGRTVEYRLNPSDNWKIDFDDLESKMNENVKLLVLINPNNPTGGIITEEELDRVIKITEKWPQCTIISDEIYDRLNFDNSHISAASRSKSVPVITLNGVSKVYYAPGWRIGYMAIHDPENRLTKVRDGIERLLRSRLCASTPAQKGYLAGLSENDDWMLKYLNKVKKQRDVCVKRINEIEGLEVQVPAGAFYMFVKLTDPQWQNNDKKFVLDLLHEEHVLLVHGSGFSPEFGKGHVRLVYLPDEKILNESFDRIDRFLTRHRENFSDS